MQADALRLMVITDWSLGEETVLLARVAAALEAGPGIAIQHRHPGATTADFYRKGLALKQVCDGAGAPLFINSRLDVALGLDAHLHLTSSSLRVADVRPHLPAGRLISAVVHDDAEAHAAAHADLALISPVFAANSKTASQADRPTLGLDGFRRLARLVPCPAFALGGLDAERLKDLPCAGAAVVSAVLHAEDPARSARSLLDALR